MEAKNRKFRLLIQLLLGAAVVMMTVSLWWGAVGSRPEALRWIPLGILAAAFILYLTPRGKQVWNLEKAECRCTPQKRLYLWGGVFIVIVLLWGGAYYYAANVRPKVFTTKAKKLISEGKVEEAYPLLRDALSGGDPEILYFYCVPYVSQEEDLMLFATGFEMLIEAAEQGFPKAQVLVGEIYRDGRGGILQSPADALRYFRMAAGQNDPDGLCRLGDMIFHGKGTEVNEQEGFQYLLTAAELGVPEAQYLTANAYDKGRGVERDREKAFEWAARAADGGNPEAMHLLGLLYLRSGIGNDPVQGRYWIEQAAERGVEAAKRYLLTTVQ